MKYKIENILEDLESQGWSVQNNFFSTELTQSLKQTLSTIRQQGLLKQAGIGRNNNFHIEQSIRSDEISWFDESNLTESQKIFLEHAEELKQEINKRFYMGLNEFEVHFALYSENSFYKRHLDQHKNQDTRVITFICYLNENWHKEDGGELKLYLNNGEIITVLPDAGTVVCFLSAEFEHEVLPAKRERASLTGWFRKRE